MEFLGIVDSFDGSLLPGMVFSYAKEGNMKSYLCTDAGRALSVKEKLKLVSHLYCCAFEVRQFCISIPLPRRLTYAHTVHSLKMIHRDIKAVCPVELTQIHLRDVLMF